jgi:DNA repair exonuclease SbcCD ATPase subunit
MTVLNDAPPLSNKANSRKDILTGESEIRIGFISKPDPNQSPIKYKVIQKQGKYVIHENGIDLKIPRIDLAKKRLSQIFPLTSSDMYNYVYYSTQRPLGFLVESNTRRSEILSDLFRLGVHDQLKEYFLQIQRSQKADTVVLDDIVAEKAKVEAQLESCVWSDDQQAKLERYETLREVYQDKILEATKTLTTLRQAVSDIRSIHVVYTKKDGYLTAIADFIAKNPDLTVLLSVTRPELLKFLLREKHHREAVTDYHNKVDRYKKNVQSKMTSVVDAAKLLADFIKGHEQAFLDSNLPSWLDRVFDVIENQPAYTKDHSDFLTDLETAVYGEGHSCAQAMAALKSDSKLQERRAADLSHVLTTLKRLTRRYKDISSITDTLNKACVMYKAPCSNHDYSPLQAKLLRLVKNISYKNGFLLGVIRDLKVAHYIVSRGFENDLI